ncbi:MAG: AAA family ATPase [Thermoanaerobaculia bacterium]|nr:AAA family ATPase [Thermoanaerobaculia bacterium]
MRHWFIRCDPRLPLEPGDDERYFDLDHVVVDDQTVSLRGRFRIEDLYQPITMLQNESCQLFSGFSGTGKSTELRRIQRNFEDNGYVVLLADAQKYHNLSREILIEDLLVVIAAAFGDALAKRLGEDPAAVSYFQQLKQLLKGVKLEEMSLSLGLVELKTGVEHAQPFWQKIREALGRSLGKLGEDVHGYVREGVARLRRAQPTSRGVVFILDNLERLTAPFGNFRAVMASVMDVFDGYNRFLRLPDCHVIYTVPPYVQILRHTLRERYDRVSHVLPAVKVLELGEKRQPYRPGVEALIELLRCRFPVDRLFGSRRDLLERLVVDSGGHVRTLITFVRELLYKAGQSGLPLQEVDLEDVTRPFREHVGLRLSREHASLLRRILQTGSVNATPESEHEALARLMDDYLVLCYRNGDDWYEVHPLARRLAERLVAELENEQAS